jgi:lysozyme family protein
MTSIDQRIDDLTELTRAQLRVISADIFEDDAVIEAAQNLVLEIDSARLRQSVARFEDATATFADLTNQLIAIIEGSTSAGRAGLNAVVREAGALLGDLAGDSAERAAKTVADLADAPTGLDDARGAPADRDAPAPGTAANSRQLSMIADEYRATFKAARIKNDKLERVDRACTRLLGFRDRYRAVGERLSIPWYFIGLVHTMESSCNFGCHLHNGDRLTERTVHVPASRPAREAGDPPFTWEQSAIDSLKSQQLHTKSDWSLPAVLFRLEAYNGWGYRFKGLASPYLWSFSDRYVAGKYVADGRFDPAAVSEQCGAAVMLKRLGERGEVELQGL